MKINYLKSFVEAIEEILNNEMVIPYTKRKISWYLNYTSSDVISLIEIHGDINAQIIIAMNKETALKIASFLFMDEFSVLDDIAVSAINELCNTISGRIITKLLQLKLDCDISPPKNFSGNMMKIDYMNVDASKIIFNSELGIFEINFAIRKRKKKK